MHMNTGRRRTLCCAFLAVVGLLVLSAPFGKARMMVVDADKREIYEKGMIQQWDCVACTFSAGVVSQLKQLHNVSARGALHMLCGFFPIKEDVLCRLASAILFNRALSLIDQNKSPDVVCQLLSYCTNPECHLFPRSNERTSVRNLQEDYGLQNAKKINICKFIPQLCSLESHLHPHYDSDDDLFSTHSTRRGSDWRGRDCDDKNPAVFPGRNTLDAVKDENCNGIYGVDKETGKTYEEMWCASSGAMGVIAVGDSVTAHFGIPEDFVMVSKLSADGFANFTHILENELDWPMLSSITGFADASDYKPNREGPMTSVYSKLLNMNRCNHRDYQNLGINGATTEQLSEMMDLVARNRTQSVKPALLFLSMLGNDVCARPPNVTTPEGYYRHLTAALEKADARLPSGSHVLISPVVDGRILYNAMHSRIHPIGSLDKDVTYADFYNYLNCLDVSPCWGWLNTDEAVRNATWKVAQSLNAQIPRILNESAKKFKNIRVHAFDDVIAGALSKYDGPVWELIEPVGGFHPSQRGTALLGEYLFNSTAALGVIPNANPFNNAITQRFGNQGGY